MKHIFIVLTVLFLMSSCSDVLDVKNHTILEESDNYKLEADISSNMLGIYSMLQDIVGDLVVLNDLRSEQLQTTDNADIDLQNIEKLNYSVENRFCNYRKYYSIINACNEFIYKSKKFLRDNPKADWNIVGAQISDVIKIRTYVYFNIGKIFGHAYYYNVPIINDLDLEKQPNIPLLGLNDLIEQLISDLKTTDIDLTTEIDWNALIGVSDNFKYYNFDVDVLLGDLYLWRENYLQAAYYFKRAINNSNNLYLLQKDVFDDNDYSRIFSLSLTGANQEIINAIEFNENNQQIFPFNNLFAVSDDKYKLKPTGKIIEIFENENPIQTVNKGDIYRGVNCSYSKIPKERVTKYGKSNVPRYPFYRVSEVHLKFCEALTMLGKFDLVYILLNDGVSPDKDPQKYWNGNAGIFKLPFDISWNINMRFNHGIRERVSLKNLELPKGFDQWEEIQKQELFLKWIFEESNLELCFEGKRFETALRFARRENNFMKYARLMATKYDSSEDDIYLDVLKDEKGWYIHLD